jgi:hypothetical protein
LYVDAQAPTGGDGASWVTAFDDLQAALAAAAASGGAVTEIRIAQGVYRPAGPGGDREATFNLGNNLAIRGGYAGLAGADPDRRNPAAFRTVLSADLDGDDGPGFVNADENAYHVLTAVGTDDTAVIDGVFAIGGNANGDVYSPHASGGGMLNGASTATIISCTFAANRAIYRGGGMYNDDCSPTLINCSFVANHCNFRGGGMYNRGGSHPTVTNCIFIANSSGRAGGAGMCNAGALTITNGIFWGNLDAHGTGEFAQLYGGYPEVNYCCVQGWTGAMGGVGNFGDDPLFVDADGLDDVLGTPDDNFRLQPGSPCVDAADNTAVPPDTTDLDDDGDTAERTPLDLAGNPRFVDNNCAVDTGVPDPPDYVAVADMGAYDYGPGDADYDADIDLGDFAGFQNCFTGEGAGQLSPNCERFDAGCDQDVDLDDFNVWVAEITGPR